MKHARLSLCATFLAGFATLMLTGCVPDAGGDTGTGGGSGTGTGGGSGSGSGGSVGSGGSTSTGSGGSVGSGGSTSTGSGGSGSGGSTSGSGGSGSGSGGSSGSGSGGNGSGSGGSDGTGGATGSGGSGSGSGGMNGGGMNGGGGRNGGSGGRGGTSGSGGAGGASTGSGGSGSGSGGAGGGSTAECPSTVIKAGDSDQTVKVGTLNRTYRLHIPTGYNGTKPLPLVVDFHPLGGTGSGQENSNSWKSKADSVGFITAYPNSYSSNNSWNVGYCCQDAQKNQIDDVAFTRAMIEQIKTLACVDGKRVYATGCSNGGGMTYKAACDLADIIAAAAPVDFRCVYGGSTQSPNCMGCKPARPISITHFDNTGDTALVPYNGGTTSFAADCPPNMSCVGMAFPSAADNFKSWQTIDGCSGSTAALSGHSTCQTNAMCTDGVQVTMCVQQGGSHCGNYNTLGIVDIAWEMFQKQALP